MERDNLLMRLWSLHPQYLDSCGLVALWREALLAKKVLSNRTIGYKNHPQLIRFKKLNSPVRAVGSYLESVYREAEKRKYRFNKSKIGPCSRRLKIPLKKGQLEYEFRHLKRKLKRRDKVKYKKLLGLKNIIPHPVFKVVRGGVEEWETQPRKINAKRK